MGSYKSKIKVMPLEVIEEHDPCYYVGNVIEKKVGTKRIFVRSGSGKQVWGDNSTYLGEFKNDDMYGQGTITYPDGSIYSGHWKNNVRHGKGQLICVRGGSYEGNWKFDEQHGKGKLIYNNGDFFVGTFKLNTICGKGVLYNSKSQKIYNGSWFNDQFHGKGTYYFTNGRKQFDGNWSQSLAHGIGIYYDKKGTIRQFGIYENGVFLKDLVEDIYNILQYHVRNDNCVYIHDSSNNLVLDTEAMDWVAKEFVSPHAHYRVDHLHSPPIVSTIEDVHGSDSSESYSEDTTTTRSSVSEGTSSSSSFVVNTGNSSYKGNGTPHVMTTSYTIKNPIAAVKESNSFLRDNNLINYDKLPSVAQKIIRQSITCNKFTPTISPPSISNKHRFSPKSSSNGFWSRLFRRSGREEVEAHIVDNPFLAATTASIRSPIFPKHVLMSKQEGCELLQLPPQHMKGAQTSPSHRHTSIHQRRRKLSIPRLNLTGIFARRAQKALVNEVDTQIQDGKGANNPILQARQRAAAGTRIGNTSIKKAFAPMRIELSSGDKDSTAPYKNHQYTRGCSPPSNTTDRKKRKKISNTNPLRSESIRVPGKHDNNLSRAQQHLNLAFAEDNGVINPLEHVPHLVPKTKPSTFPPLRSMIT